MALGSLSESYGRLSLRGAGHRRVSRRLLTGCLIATLALLVVLACADPPDPSWIFGIYDNGDYDDAVGLVADGTGVSNCQTLWQFEGRAKLIELYAVTARVPRAANQGQIIRGPPTKTRDLL